MGDNNAGNEAALSERNHGARAADAGGGCVLCQPFIQGLQDAHAAGMFAELNSADWQLAAAPTCNSSVSTEAFGAGAGSGRDGQTADLAGGGEQAAAVTKAAQVQSTLVDEGAQGAAMEEAIQLHTDGVLTDAEQRARADFQSEGDRSF